MPIFPGSLHNIQGAIYYGSIGVTEARFVAWAMACPVTL